uniref:Kringle-containing protein marking the eye and the nose n=1 Tax=Phallusia mammillata TaxID=59560 RepID=A0A6F9DFK1_9ASCI|nr:kremen protein 1-like [Phallusia mammillata]
MSFRQIQRTTCSWFLIVLLIWTNPASANGPDVTECYTVNGADYEGSQSHVESPTSTTSSFTPCVRWADAGVEEFQSLPNNYCRNSNNSVFPWCFVSVGVGQVEARMCDIPTCSTPAYVGCFRPNINTTMTSDGVIMTTPLMNGADMLSSDPKMKISRCLNFCRSRKYNYAGLTRGHSCLCSKWPNSMESDAALSDANRLPAARCRQIHCVEDPIHPCGGNDAVAVYDTDAGSCKVKYFNQTHGTIYSPRWPGRYQHNLSCSWQVYVPKWFPKTSNYAALFSFLHFDLHGSEDVLDFITFEGVFSAGSKIASYNGTLSDPADLEIPVDNTTKVFLLNFKSDGAKARKGFVISFKFRKTETIASPSTTQLSISTEPPVASTISTTTITTETTTTVTTTTASTITTTPRVIPSTTAEANYDSKSPTTSPKSTKPAGQAPSKPPVNVIVIGVACALVVLVTVSVVVVIEMKRRRKKVPKEITPPADFKNPVTFNNGSKTVNIV